MCQCTACAPLCTKNFLAMLYRSHAVFLSSLLWSHINMPARKGSTAKRPAAAKHTSSTTQKRASAQPARARNSVQVQQRPSVRPSPSAGRNDLRRAPSNNAQTTSASRYSPQRDRRPSEAEAVRTLYAPRTSASRPTQDNNRPQSSTTRQYDNNSRLNTSAADVNNSRPTPAPPQSNSDYRNSTSASANAQASRQNYTDREYLTTHGPASSRQDQYPTSSPIFASQHHHYGNSPQLASHQIQGYSPQHSHHTYQNKAVIHYDAQGRPIPLGQLNYSVHAHLPPSHYINAAHLSEQEKWDREKWEREQMRKEERKRQKEEQRWHKEESKSCACIIS